MFCVYLRKSPRAGQIYIGFAEDLKWRFTEHHNFKGTKNEC